MHGAARTRRRTERVQGPTPSLEGFERTHRDWRSPQHLLRRCSARRAIVRQTIDGEQPSGTDRDFSPALRTIRPEARPLITLGRVVTKSPADRNACRALLLVYRGSRRRDVVPARTQMESSSTRRDGDGVLLDLRAQARDRVVAGCSGSSRGCEGVLGERSLRIAGEAEGSK
jgi:hypothetical protein